MGRNICAFGTIKGTRFCTSRLRMYDGSLAMTKTTGSPKASFKKDALRAYSFAESSSGGACSTARIMRRSKISAAAKENWCLIKSDKEGGGGRGLMRTVAPVT